MAPRELSFGTTLQPDAALAINARYTFDSADRQSIDQQIRGLQGFASRAHLNGTFATFLTLVGTAAGAGTVVCSANGLTGKPTVTIATPDALATAGVALGVLLENASVGGKALVAVNGLIAPAVTGLAIDDPGWVRVDADGRCEKVASLEPTDVVVGWVDNGGYLRVALLPALAGPSGTAPFVVDSAASIPTIPNARLVGALEAPLAFKRRDGLPVRITHEAAAGTVEEVLALGRTIASNGAGSDGTGASISFYITDATPGSNPRTGRVRQEWTSAGVFHSKMVLSTRNNDGEHDWFTLDHDGAIRAHAYAAGPVQSDASGNWTSSTTAAVRSDGGLDTVTATALPLGGNNATAFVLSSTTGVITYKKASATTRVDTFGGVGASTSVWSDGVSSITESWSQAAAGAGGTWSREGQQGHVGSVGGDVLERVGKGGTPGTNAPGNYRIDVGQPVSQVSGKFQIEAPAGTPILKVGMVGGPYVRVENSNTSAGLWLNATGILYLKSDTYIACESPFMQANESTGQSVYYSGGLAMLHEFPAAGAQALTASGTAASFSFKAGKQAGTGAAAGVPVNILAGDGQNVAAGTNNSGGTLTLASGAPGTGGTGGTPGAVRIKTGATDRIVIAEDGTLLAVTVDQVRLPYAKALAWRDSSDSVDKVMLSLRASPDSLEDDCLVLGGEGVLGGLEYRVSADAAHRFMIDGSAALTIDGEGGVVRASVDGPLKLLNVTLAGLASYPPADHVGASVLVTDQTGGQGIASSNGTNWISDRTGSPVL